MMTSFINHGNDDVISQVRSDHINGSTADPLRSVVGACIICVPWFRYPLPGSVGGDMGVVTMMVNVMVMVMVM